MRMFWSLVEKDERISLDTFDAFLIILSMCLSNWKYFSYDRASDKSRCLIDDMKDSSGIQKCDALLNGNNATNLKNHLKYKHKSVYAELEKLECQSKDSRKATNLTGDLPKRQTQQTQQNKLVFKQYSLHNTYCAERENNNRIFQWNNGIVYSLK